MTAWPVGSKSTDVEVLTGADEVCSVAKASTVVATSKPSDGKSDERPFSSLVEIGSKSEEFEVVLGSSVPIDTVVRYVDRYVMQYVPGAKSSYLISPILAEANAGLTTLISSARAAA
jgi:hypothetical protein